MKAHSETVDRIPGQLSVWISGLTFAVVLLLGSLMIETKTDLGIIKYQLKDLDDIKKTVKALETNQKSLAENQKTLATGQKEISRLLKADK